jgi:hypothetical protein
MVNNIAKVYKKTNLHQQGSDFTDWQARPYAVRSAVLEEILREYQVWEQSTRGDADCAGFDLEHLKQNKKASGRLQDLADLEIWNN